MSNRNKNAGREPAPTRPARRPSITSPTELAVHLGRELSASAVDGNGWTDLHYAAALDWLAMARALLAAGARLDARLRADREPLGPALVSTLSGCGQDWFRLLRRNGATPLHIAAVANASEAVGVLLEGGADPDVADATSATPLHYAAAGHSGPAAAVLAARGADVSAATAKGVTPLHAAARRDAVPVVRVLLEHGADVGAQDVGGDTPLHRAASGDAASSAALLLDRGADTAARANDGVPPLHVAALKNAGRVAQVLLDHGADVGARVNDGVTPLHVAALKDAAGIVAALLSHRADLGAEDAAGQAPLHWAAMGNAAAAAAVLIDHGAHVHARGGDGSTPLHTAAFNDAAVAVRALLERGADIHARDAARLTPLHWAAAGDGGSVAEVLLACGAGIDARSVPGLKIYSFLSGRYGSFHSNVIGATAGEAPFVLDGLVDDAAQFDPLVHHVDTGGVSDHVFALFHLLGLSFAPRLGLSFAPRLRDFPDRRLACFGRPGRWKELAPLMGKPINEEVVLEHWNDALRLTASIKTVSVTPSAMLRKLGAYRQQNRLYLALGEIGRIERTLFMLDWMESPQLRMECQAGLNKGEARHALARAVFAHAQGRVHDRSHEAQQKRVMALNLVIAAIVYWNTAYIEKAATHLRRERRLPDPTLLRHVSPLGWEHIVLTGDYDWNSGAAERTNARPLNLYPARIRA